MSLWEKWEREKLKKQGIKVKSHDVEIHDQDIKPNIKKQLYVVTTVLILCLLVVYLGISLGRLYSQYEWSDSFIVRLFVEKAKERGLVDR